jgi:hypothetical protein
MRATVPSSTPAIIIQSASTILSKVLSLPVSEKPSVRAETFSLFVQTHRRARGISVDATSAFGFVPSDKEPMTDQELSAAGEAASDEYMNNLVENISDSWHMSVVLAEKWPANAVKIQQKAFQLAVDLSGSDSPNKKLVRQCMAAAVNAINQESTPIWKRTFVAYCAETDVLVILSRNSAVIDWLSVILDYDPKSGSLTLSFVEEFYRIAKDFNVNPVARALKSVLTPSLSDKVQSENKNFVLHLGPVDGRSQVGVFWRQNERFVSNNTLCNEMFRRLAATYGQDGVVLDELSQEAFSTALLKAHRQFSFSQNGTSHAMKGIEPVTSVQDKFQSTESNLEYQSMRVLLGNQAEWVDCTSLWEIDLASNGSSARFKRLIKPSAEDRKGNAGWYLLLADLTEAAQALVEAQAKILIMPISDFDIYE